MAYHWGAEYVSVPTVGAGIAEDDPVEIGHLAVDAGADFVIGNHPHWVQGVELYKGKYIAYAHGNFIFDQMWSYETRVGVVGKYTFYDEHARAARSTSRADPGLRPAGADGGRGAPGGAGRDEGFERGNRGGAGSKSEPVGAGLILDRHAGVPLNVILKRRLIQITHETRPCNASHADDRTLCIRALRPRTTRRINKALWHTIQTSTTGDQSASPATITQTGAYYVTSVPPRENVSSARSSTARCG